MKEQTNEKELKKLHGICLENGIPKFNRNILGNNYCSLATRETAKIICPYLGVKNQLLGVFLCKNKNTGEEEVISENANYLSLKYSLLRQAIASAMNQYQQGEISKEELLGIELGVDEIVRNFRNNSDKSFKMYEKFKEYIADEFFG